MQELRQIAGALGIHIVEVLKHKSDLLSFPVEMATNSALLQYYVELNGDARTAH